MNVLLQHISSTAHKNFKFLTASVVCDVLLLGSITNGMISHSTPVTVSNTVHVGTVATCTCNSGYELSTTGDQTRTCMNKGDGSGASFRGNAPSCDCKYLCI